MSEKIQDFKEKSQEDIETSILNIVTNSIITGLKKIEAIKDLSEYLELTLRTKEERAAFLEKLRYAIEITIRSTIVPKRLENQNLEDVITSRTNEALSEILTNLLIEQAPDSTVSDEKEATSKKIGETLA